MRSISIAHVRRGARQARESRAAHVVARAGLTARGVIYLLIGWIAVLVALGRSSRQADQQGALHLDETGAGMTILRLPGAGQFERAVRLATEDDASVAGGFLAVIVRPWQVMATGDRSPSSA